MHDDEVRADAEQVRRLVAGQFPAWAGLAVRPVKEFGTDHVLFRLGRHLAVRMPRVAAAIDQVGSDGRWLPILARSLPVPVPEQVAVGAPDEGFPWPWSVVRWLPGSAPGPCSVSAAATGEQLGRFVSALRAVDPAGAPVRTDRGAPLALRDPLVRADLEDLGPRVDRAAVLAVWEDALAAPVWDGAPAWTHGDLKAGNLLLAGERLAGVIDWASLGLGDPALDLTAAWLALRGDARRAFRGSCGLDEAAWRRGRGWALTISLRELPYYWDRSPQLAQGARLAVGAILEDVDG